MQIWKCSDKFKYGCTTEVEYDTVEDLKGSFGFSRYKDKIYPNKICNKCYARRKREKIRSGHYNSSERVYSPEDYGKFYA